MTEDLVIAVHPDSVAHADQAAEQARAVTGRGVRVQVSPLVCADLGYACSDHQERQAC